MSRTRGHAPAAHAPRASQPPREPQGSAEEAAALDIAKSLNGVIWELFPEECATNRAVPYASKQLGVTSVEIGHSRPIVKRAHGPRSKRF